MGERVLVVGESVVDVVPSADGLSTEHPGGSPANVAVALTRLGAPVDLVTAVGDDARGELLLSHLRASGIEVVGDPVVLPRTSTAVAQLDADGVASYDFDLRSDLPDTAPDPSRTHVHTGSIAAVVEPGGSAVRRAVMAHRTFATVSYDINARPALTGAGPGLVATVEDMCALSDLVKASHEDLEVVYPGEPVEQAARRILALGPAAVVVTRGPVGATCYTGQHVVEVPGYDVTVADTIGAGDSFLAGLLDGLLRLGLLGRPRAAELRAAPAALWRSVLCRACAAAAITVSRAGANPPTSVELEPTGA